MAVPELTPEWRWLVYPPSAVDQRKVDAFVVADLAADLISGKPSSWGGVYVRGTTGGISEPGDWKRIGADLSITGAGFARFLPDGGIERFPSVPQSNAFGGFFILPTSRAQSSVVSGQGTPVAGMPVFGWTPTEGEWETSPALAGRGTGILSRSSGGAGIKSDADLGANQGFEIQFDFLSYGSSGGECFLRYGRDVRLALRQGYLPVVERRTTSITGSAQASEWTTWKQLSEFEGFHPRGTRARFQVSQIGGRKVVEWNGRAVWFLDENEKENQNLSLGTRARAAIPQWGGVPLQLEVKGCRVRGELALLDYLDDDGNAPRQATITRKVPLASAGSYQARLLKPLATGFVPTENSSMKVSLAHDEESITYTVTLQGDDQGLQAPCVGQMLLSYAPVWVNGSGSPQDFSAAVTGGRVTLSQPPNQAGSEGSVTVDFNLAQKKCPDALPLLQDFAPFEVSARWRADATGQPVSDYRGLMQGYLFGSDGEQPGYNQRSAEFTLRDPIVRLHDEAGLVDSNFGDLRLDYNRLTLERIGMALDEIRADSATDGYKNPFTPEEFIPVSAGAYYGGDAVQYILRTQLGSSVADKLNGNGDGTRYYPKSHPALISRYDANGSISGIALSLGQTLGIGSLAPNEKGESFSPPFGRDCLGWITDIGRDDLGCDFWFGHVNRDTDSWPVPIYGKYEVFLDSAKGWRLDTKDALDIAGLVEAASVQSRPESAINRVLVWANPFGVEIPFVPAFIQGEARVAGGPSAPHNSWARTLVFKEGFSQWITSSRDAAEVAAAILLDINDTSNFYPKYRTRGDARWLVGDVFFARNLGLNINDLYVRAASIEHAYTVDASEGRWWTTEVSLQPMTNRQIARFNRLHSLEGTYIGA